MSTDLLQKIVSDWKAQHLQELLSRLDPTAATTTTENPVDWNLNIRLVNKQCCDVRGVSLQDELKYLCDSVVNAAYACEGHFKKIPIRTSLDEMQEMLQSNKGSFFVLELVGPKTTTILACWWLEIKEEQSLYLGMLSVPPVFQGLNLGNLIMDLVEDVIGRCVLKDAVSAFEIRVVVANAHLVRWYTRRGFEPFGTELWPEHLRYQLLHDTHFIKMRKSFLKP